MQLAYASARRKGLPIEDVQDCGIGFTVHMLTRKTLLTRVEAGERISPAWLTTCAEHWTTNFVRCRRRLHARERLAADMPERALVRRDTRSDIQEIGSPEAECIRSELRRRVLSAALFMTESQYCLFTQRCLHGYSVEEIARQTGRAPNAVKQALAVMRHRLQTLLIREGLTSEEICQYLHLIASKSAPLAACTRQTHEE